MSIKISRDNIGNRTRDLPTCSAVPQPTTLPRVPYNGVSGGQSSNLARLFLINFLLLTMYLFSTTPHSSLVRAYYNGLLNEVLIIRPNKTFRSNKITFYYTLHDSAVQISDRQVDLRYIVYPTSTETYCSV